MSNTPPLIAMISSGLSPFAVGTDGQHLKNVDVLCEGHGDGRFTFRVVSHSDVPLAIREVVLLDTPHGFAPDTELYGEGFSMFCSTGGSVGKPEPIDPSYTDESHYRLRGEEGFHTVYNYARFRESDGQVTLVGFASCRRFNGRLHLNPTRLRVVMDMEGIVIQPGEEWELEELVLHRAADAASVMAAFASSIAQCHPRLPWTSVPNGWCSWYGYGPDISCEIIEANLETLRQHAPELRHILIDDGYQPWMGDWLETGALFPGGVERVVHRIIEAGFEPALWVAPFIASPESRLFREHPDFFVTDAEGRPLGCEGLTFAGWRQGPWYMLDGSHPEACGYLEHVFSTFRAWGVRFFKLDANAWGALPFGHRRDTTATSVAAYRKGMEAIRRGTGEDSLLLGCNHAYWPSLGTIHASRTSYDIARSFPGFTRVARENLLRNWMNDRLWWNDPDCLVLPLNSGGEGLVSADGMVPYSEHFTPEEAAFHFTATLASGGMLLSGDRVVEYGPSEWSQIRKAIALASGASAHFPDDKLEIGWLDISDHERRVFLLNWTTSEVEREVPCPWPARIWDVTSEASPASCSGPFRARLAPQEGRVLQLLREAFVTTH